MSEEDALAAALFEEMKRAPAKVLEAPHRTFHAVRADKVFYPGDLGPAFARYDSRASSYYDANAVERWYRAQVPNNAAFVHRHDDVQVLYLPACVPSYGVGLDLDIGDDAFDLKTDAVERLWIRRALEAQGLDEVEIPDLHRGTIRREREHPLPEITELNRHIAEAIEEQDGNGTDRPKVMLVLEAYCGSRTEQLLLPNLIPEPEPPPLYPPPPQGEERLYYRLELPAGATKAYTIGFLFAEACRIRKKSRFRMDCYPLWTEVGDGNTLPGRGRFRLIATINGAARSFRYTVQPAHLNRDGRTGPTVTLTPEP